MRTEDEFKSALDEAFKWEDNLVIEEYVEGREFSIGVIDYKALPIIEIAPIQGFYDYKNKYKAGSAVETCPAELPEEITKQMQHYAERVAEVLGLHIVDRNLKCAGWTITYNRRRFCGQRIFCFQFRYQISSLFKKSLTVITVCVKVCECQI